jgi:hypothetical protein
MRRAEVEILKMMAELYRNLKKKAMPSKKSALQFFFVEYGTSEWYQNDH